MKGYILMLISIIICSTTFAQRMLPKQKGLELNGGILTNQKPQKNYFLNLSLTINAGNGNYWIYGAEYDHEAVAYKITDIPVGTYTANMGFSLRLFGDTQKRININLALMGIAGYRMINKGQAVLYDGSVIEDKQGLVYGIGSRLSFEYYVTNGWIILIQGKAAGLWGAPTEHFRPMAGIGFRFNF